MENAYLRCRSNTLPMSDTKPDTQSLVQYSVMALPLAFAGLPLYIHMPDFYTREFGMSIGTLGIVLLIIRLIDAVQDPVIGYISDRKKKRLFLLIYTGLACLALGMSGLSIGPPAQNVATVWFCVFMILATTGFSIITINMNMLGGFWTQDPQQRITISSWREGFGLLGLLISALLPTVVQNYASDRMTFILVLLVFGLLFVFGGLLFHRFIQAAQDADLPVLRPQQSSFVIVKILAQKERLFFLICFLSYFAASIPAVLVLFFIRDYLDSEAFTGLFLALYFLSGALFVGLWSTISRRYPPYKVWACAMILSVMTFFSALFLSSGDGFAYGVVCIVSGITLGADLALPPALIAGRIQQNRHEHQAVQYYAVLAFLPKAAIAMAAGFAFLSLEKAGFVANQPNSEAALHTLIVLYALVPCIIKGLSALLLFRLIKLEG